METGPESRQLQLFGLAICIPSITYVYTKLKTCNVNTIKTRLKRLSVFKGYVCLMISLAILQNLKNFKKRGMTRQVAEILGND